MACRSTSSPAKASKWNARNGSFTSTAFGSTFTGSRLATFASPARKARMSAPSRTTSVKSSVAVRIWPDSRRVCVAIGMFDGVHLGHQQVIRQTIEDARQHEGIAVAITFDCHPNSVVAPERNPPLIYSLSQRLRVIESLGIDVALSIHFDQAFSEISGEQFIRALVRDFRN